MPSGNSNLTLISDLMFLVNKKTTEQKITDSIQAMAGIQYSGK